MELPNNKPSCSKDIIENGTNKKNYKRKNEDPPANQETSITKTTEENSFEDSSKFDSEKIDSVSEYAKKSRLDFNFWEELTGPSNSQNEKILEIKDLKIGNYVGKPLKFRVTYKSNVRPGRSGLVFNVHGMDISSEIGMVCFGNDGTRFNEILKINMVYYLDNFFVELEKEEYPSGTGNKLQIKLKTKSKFTLIDDRNFPEIVFNFIPINSINAQSYNDKVDILGILVKDDGLQSNYRNSPKRDLALTDKSKETVFITLWGIDASNFNSKLYSVILIKRGYILEVEGKNKINCLYGTLIWCNPQLPQAADLEKWFKAEQCKLQKK